jgi:hypothetical protein
MKSALRWFFGRLAWLFFALAGACFLFGDAIITAFGNAERLLAEAESIALSIPLAGLGFLAELIEESLDNRGSSSTSISLRDALRK